MNIFVLDMEPRTAAIWHVNSHITKMPLETAQLLCTTLVGNKILAPYKQAYVKHPCVIWVQESRDNFKWLCELGIRLCEEYTFRYGRVHKSQEVIEYCARFARKMHFPFDGLTPHYQAMPDDVKHVDSVQAYRNYYMVHKRHLAVWKLRKKPHWYV